MNDVVLNKKDSIERCIEQIRKYYFLPSDIPFKDDHLRRDAISANLQRACEQCIDLANHIARQNKLGIPKTSRESFGLLAKHKIISDEMCRKLQGMISFRNILVHQYCKINVEILVDVIENKLDDLIDYTAIILATQINNG